MKLDREFFVKRYRVMDDDELFGQLAGVELSDTALEAVSAVLVERGLDDEQISERLRVAKRSHRPGAATNSCDYCGASLAFGAVREGQRFFCGANCARAKRVAYKAEEIETADAAAFAEVLRLGECPRCERVDGTVEMRSAHHIYSYIKSYASVVEAQLYCRRCGRNANLLAVLGNVVVGWWSIPGLILTPVYVARNLMEIRRHDCATTATPQLIEIARLSLAAKALDAESSEGDVDEANEDDEEPTER